VLLLRLQAGGETLRPGAPVLAYLPVPGGRRAGVFVPRSAVVRFQGRAWVYLQTEEESFVRRELAQAEPTDSGWFTSVGLAAGEHVVVEGAQVLLSEEQKHQIEQEEAASE
jgi:membrane fusion protein, multidrug efflux system